MKKTPEQVALARRQTRYNMTRNNCLSSFSLKNCRTLYQQLEIIGYTDEWKTKLYPSDGPLTYKEVAERYDEWFTTLEKAFSEPVIKPVEPITSLVLAPEIIKPLELEVMVDESKWLPEDPKITCKLYDFQEREAKKIVSGLVNNHAIAMRGGVGIGKTFIALRVASHMIRHKLVPPNFALYPVIYITKASVVEQTKRVAENMFGLDTIHDIYITNIEELRTSKFRWCIKVTNVIVNGEEHEKIEWMATRPGLILVDESQGLKNEDSKQSRIFQALNDIIGVKQFHFSATPWLRPADAKCFAVATHLNVASGAGHRALTNQLWPAWVKEIAHPADPLDYCEASMQRMMKELNPYIVNVKGVRSQFKAVNGTRLVNFRNKEQADHYHTAWDKHQRRMAKLKALEGDGVMGTGFMALASLTVFRRAAEWCHSENFADMMHDAWSQGYAPVAAFSFKQTAIRITKFLIEKHGYSRDDISLIWGGGKGSGPTEKQEMKMKLDAQMELLKAAGISMGDLGMDDVDDYEEESVKPEWRLGVQSLVARQAEIDRFQKGLSKFCLFTFKAGGVGLSLHHCDEQTGYKVKRTRAGWYVPDDIPNCPTRPRMTFLTPTYSAIELVQGLGRAPRITSMSDTIQTILFFAGTIEGERVMPVVSQKLRCLRHVVQAKEDWQGIIAGGLTTEQKAEYTDDDDSGGLFVGDVSEDEDDN